jgi:SEC-C motif
VHLRYTGSAGKVRMIQSTHGRNTPCWCGSGKKYKKCHLEADRAAATQHGSPTAARARDIFKIRDSILDPRQVRSDEIGSSRD